MLESCAPERLLFEWSAPTKTALFSSAPSRFAPEKSMPGITSPDRFLPDKSAFIQLALGFSTHSDLSGGVGGEAFSSVAASLSSVAASLSPPHDVIVKKIVKAIIVCEIFFLTRGVRKFINSIVLFRNFLGSLEHASLVTKIQIIL